MGLVASSSGGSKFEPIPEGVYNALCYSIVDCGDQYSEKFNNTARKVLITWELPDETIEIDGEVKPRAISKEYTLSLADKANLRKHLEAWRSKKFTDEELTGFDLKNVMGKGCQVQIIHNAKGYAEIASIMALPKGTKLGTPVNPTVYFDLEAEGALEQLNKIPTWVQDKIKKSETYKAMVNAGVPDGFYPIEDDDELPF